MAGDLQFVDIMTAIDGQTGQLIMATLRTEKSEAKHLSINP